MSSRAQLLSGGCCLLCVLAALLILAAPSPAAVHPYNQGCRALEQGDYTAAVKAFQKALKLDANDTDALNNLAVSWIKLEKYDRALPLLEKVLRINAGYAGAHLNIGADYLLQEELSLALPPTRKAQLASGGARARQVKADAFYNLGLIQAAQGEYGQAADSFRRSVETSRATDAMIARGAAQCAAGQYDAGIKSLEQAAGSASGAAAQTATANLAVAHYRRGLKRLAAHNVAGAKTDIEASLAAAPSDAARLASGVVQAESGDVEAAVETFTAVRDRAVSEEIAAVAQRNIDHGLELLGQQPGTSGSSGGGVGKWLILAMGIVLLLVYLLALIRAIAMRKYRGLGGTIKIILGVLLGIPVFAALYEQLTTPDRGLVTVLVALVTGVVMIVYMWRGRTSWTR